MICKSEQTKIQNVYILFTKYRRKNLLLTFRKHKISILSLRLKKGRDCDILK